VHRLTANQGRRRKAYKTGKMPMSGSYADIYKRSIADPEGFWGEAAEAITWSKPWDKVLDDQNAPFYRWFSGAETNVCYNAVDRHVENGRADQAAIIYDSPVTDTKQTITYKELQDQVARLAGVLRKQGVGKGDRVLIYMPMIPQAAYAMLACARLGAIHSVVFGGFAAKELATRINDSAPKAVLCASCGIEPGRVVHYKPLLDEAISLATSKPETVIMYQRPQEQGSLIEGRDFDWEEEIKTAEPAECVTMKATDPLYVLYTSGTTGKPKGVVRDCGGYMVALCWSMKNLYNVAPGDVYWAASDVGWVVGHSYIVYGPLLNGNTTIIFEGKPVGTPDPGTFWRVISEHKVKALFTAPTAFRAIKKEDPEGSYLKKYDMSGFQTLFLAGERCDPDTFVWAQKLLNVPVVDHWWQTETGWAICANPVGIEEFPAKPGSAALPMPGWDMKVLDPNQIPQAPGQIGALVAKLPMPPGAMPTLWNDDERFVESYMKDFPGYYKTGDAGIIDEDGYIHVMSRTDDVINVAGHRLSTGEMEEVLASHQDVAECAVIGVYDKLKGQVPLGFVVLKSGVDRDHHEIAHEVVKMVRDQIGPVAAFKHATVVKRLPKTRSGKILRGTMQKIADGNDYNMPATIDDPNILPEIEESLQDIGFAQKAG